ncbi:post-GPI attachment to proteins factor 2-like isoform X2 [Planococcus citri]
MVVKSKHLIFNYDETKGYYLCFPLSKLIWCTISLPFFAFIFCVVWSILYNFEETTFTHCKVWNFLPSISAAIGNHMTQYIVWVTAVTLHSGPRFLFISIYYRYYLKMIKHQKQYIAKVACTLNVIENISLLGLTYLSSAGSYAIHEKCFITFMASSELYMLLTCILFRYHRKTNTMDKFEAFSLRMKTRLLIVNAISFSTAGYFFLRHNKYCEPGIYTLFAFFEYIVVLSNMAFHLTALFDFKDQCITVYKKGIDVR